MKTLILLWNVLTLMTHGFNALEVKTDPGMIEGQPSYIHCDVGTVTAGVAFYKEPANLQGSCIAPGIACTSSLYTITQNVTGALLQIASVDASRDEGVWYCQHDADRSINSILVNNHTIAGFLLKEDWKEPVSSEPIQEFTAVMTLSCTNKMPSISFSYEDNQSTTGPVPTEALTTTTQSSYDGITCWNGNLYYVIRLTASNNLAVFNNKQGLSFTFNYYGMSRAAGFSVDFLEELGAASTSVSGRSNDYLVRNTKFTVVAVVCTVFVLIFVVVILF